MTSGVDALSVIPQAFGQDATIKGLKKDSKAETVIWKDLGQHLEQLAETPPQNSPFKADLLLQTPLSNALQYRVCTLCNRPILLPHTATHVKLCIERQEKKKQQHHQQQHHQHQHQQQQLAMAEDKNSKKRKLDKEATPATDDKNKTKKPKKDLAPPKPKKKAATPKNKGPVDVERQCGVALPGGGFCARSLTCKTHSMGAKRAVPGRSASYDELLAAYQHRNQVKIAGQAAKAQAAKDEMLHASSATLDSDEETQQVLAGVSRSFALPLERNNLVSTRVRTNFLRMREMFAGAILPRITNSNGVGGFNGRTALLDIDRSNDYLFIVRAPQRIMMNSKPSVTSTPNSTQATIQTPPQSTPGAAAAALAQQQQANRNAQLMAQQAAARHKLALQMQQQQQQQQQNQ